MELPSLDFIPTWLNNPASQKDTSEYQFLHVIVEIFATPHLDRGFLLSGLSCLSWYVANGIKIRESGAQAQHSTRLGARLRRDEAMGQ